MTCPCGSDNALDACCGPYLSGAAQPPSAEALMRARYTAYATGEVDFVLQTQQVEGEASDREATEAWSRQSTWLGLDVVKVEGGGALDDEGTVEFVARYSHKDQEYAHHEQASFKKVDGRWLFIDGKMVNSTFQRSTPKIKPNEPCPCGSGKKYKKCCGKR